MNVSKVGVTQIRPIKDTLYGAHRDFVLGDCVEIRERVLKNGTKILAGYRKNSEYSNLIQKINPNDVIISEINEICDKIRDVYGDNAMAEELRQQ